MIALNLINNLTRDTLKYLDAESLTDERVLAKLFQLSSDRQFDLESGKALEFYEELSEILKNNLNKVQAKPLAYNQIAAILWILSWKALPSMPLKFSGNILSANLINSIKLGINVRESLERIIGPYEFQLGPDKESRRGWIYALERNQEKLGTKAVTLDTGTMQPTVENWLKSYNLNQPLTKGRAKFNQINFLNTSKDAAQLSKEDNQILKELIEIYDWLLFPPPGPILVPDSDYKTEAPAPSSSFSNREKFRLPEEMNPGAGAGASAVKEAFTPAAPAVPKPAKPVGQAIIPPEAAGNLPQKPELPNLEKPFKPVDIAEILKKREAENPQIRQKLNPYASQNPMRAAQPNPRENLIAPPGQASSEDLKSAYINKKLEELKKKSGNNS